MGTGQTLQKTQYHSAAQHKTTNLKEKMCKLHLRSHSLACRSCTAGLCSLSCIAAPGSCTAVYHVSHYPGPDIEAALVDPDCQQSTKLFGKFAGLPCPLCVSAKWSDVHQKRSRKEMEANGNVPAILMSATARSPGFYTMLRFQIWCKNRHSSQALWQDRTETSGKHDKPKRVCCVR